MLCTTPVHLLDPRLHCLFLSLEIAVFSLHGFELISQLLLESAYHALGLRIFLCLVLLLFLGLGFGNALDTVGEALDSRAGLAARALVRAFLLAEALAVGLLRAKTATVISEQIGNLLLRLLHPEQDLTRRCWGLALAVLQVIEELLLFNGELAEVAGSHLRIADVQPVVLTLPLFDLFATVDALVGPVLAVRVVLIVDHLLVA